MQCFILIRSALELEGFGRVAVSLEERVMQQPGESLLLNASSPDLFPFNFMLRLNICMLYECHGNTGLVCFQPSVAAEGEVLLVCFIGMCEMAGLYWDV